GGVFNGIPDGSSSSADVDTNNHKDLAGRLVVHLNALGLQLGGSHGTEGGAAPSFKTSIGQTWFTYAPSVTAGGTRNRIAPAVFYYHGPLGAFAEFVRSAQPMTHAAGAAVIA